LKTYVHIYFCIHLDFISVSTIPYSPECKMTSPLCTLQLRRQDDMCFQKSAFFAAIRILNSLSRTLTSLRNEKTHFKVTLICYLSTLYSVDELFMFKNSPLCFVWKSLQCFCCNSSVYFAFFFIFCMFIAVPHHTVVLAMFCICVCVCVCACAPVPHFLTVHASQLFCIDNLKP
jgi:hypothetical protein